MKKGFTLVELLATIVVLGVIALIAIPTVMDSVATAKEQAALSSIDGLIKAAENYYYKRSSEGNEISEYENILSLIEYKGEQPESGQMRFFVVEHCKFRLNTITNAIEKYQTPSKLLMTMNFAYFPQFLINNNQCFALSNILLRLVIIKKQSITMYFYYN